MMPPLLTKQEAFDGAESFLRAIYGSDVYARWQDLKIHANFKSERDYVSWLLDIANDYYNSCDGVGGDLPLVVLQPSETSHSNFNTPNAAQSGAKRRKTSSNGPRNRKKRNYRKTAAVTSGNDLADYEVPPHGNGLDGDSTVSDYGDSGVSGGAGRDVVIKMENKPSASHITDDLRCEEERAGNATGGVGKSEVGCEGVGVMSGEEEEDIVIAESSVVTDVAAAAGDAGIMEGTGQHDHVTDHTAAETVTDAAMFTNDDDYLDDVDAADIQVTAADHDDESLDISNSASDGKNPAADKTSLEVIQRVSEDGVTPRFHCPHCGFVSVHRCNVTKHIDAVHYKRRPFSCPYCEYNGNRRHQLASHLINHHGHPGRYTCDKCRTKSFAVLSMLKKHQIGCRKVVEST